MFLEKMNDGQLSPMTGGRFMKPQKTWKWQVPVDIYLAGMGGGTFIFAMIIGWLGYFSYLPKAVLLWGFIPVAGGAALLVLELGMKHRFLRTLLNPRSSWLSRGFLILSGFMVLSFISCGVAVLPYLGINIDLPFMPFVEGLGFAFGIGVALYTGALIRSTKSVPLWSTKWLLAVFFVSALSTGLMVIILAILAYDLVFSFNGYASSQMQVMVAIGLAVMTLERIVLGIYLYLRYKAAGQSANSVYLLLKGNLSKLFYGGVMVAGYFGPIFFSILYFIFPNSYVLLALVALSALLGCLILRICIIYAGIKDQTPLQKFAEVQYFLRMPGNRMDELFDIMNSRQKGPF
jgi:formate-dependent nitrite reductase membrane component NrfD